MNDVLKPWLPSRSELADLAGRMGHTFWQTFVAVFFAATVSDWDSAKAALVAALTAAGASVLSALKTWVQDWAGNRKAARLIAESPMLTEDEAG